MADTPKYAIKNENTFAEFEPYYCGYEAIPADTFLNAGHYQAYETGTRFADIVIAEGYTINGGQIRGCKKGTIPIALPGGSNKLYTLENSTALRHYLITKIDNALVIKKVGSKNTALTDETTITLEQINAFREGDAKLNAFPDRIGFVLVGSGGGCGGATWYDAEKNGSKEDRIRIPGAGGGGGGIIWGVLDLTDNKMYMVEVGGWGGSGFNATTDNLTHNKPKSGKAGGPGRDSMLYYVGRNLVGANLTNETISYVFNDAYNVDSRNMRILATAKGGSGGSPGHWSTTAGGGAGGRAFYSNETFDDDRYWWYIGGQNGNDGCSCNPNSDNEMYSYEKNIDITFLADATENKDYTYHIHHDQIKAIATVGDGGKIPGGHSFGNGGMDSTAATYGGGGGWRNGSSSQGVGGGATGCFMLFY